MYTVYKKTENIFQLQILVLKHEYNQYNITATPIIHI